MPVSADPHIGTNLLGYEIEALIGRGGMGVVYRARERALDRRVALKLIAPELAAFTGFRGRFLAESRLAASLEHPNVVPIYAAGDQDGHLYLAMRHIEGRDLKRILLEGPLSPTRTIAVCSQVASALDAAHDQGLVHRDVKPSNVLLDARDHAYLADFGLTRLLSDVGQSPTPTSSLGTLEYVAPEQIRGDPADARADVYSLGCMLCECMTGHPPFGQRSAVALLFAHLEQEPPAPPGLEQVMARALAKDPTQRYATCTELVDAAATALGVVRPRRRRWPVAAAALVAAGIAVAVGAVLLTGGGSARAATGGRLLQIDPTSDQVTRSLTIGAEPTAVAVGGRNRVWVTCYRDPRVWMADPQTGGVTHADTDPSFTHPIDVAATHSAAYVVDDFGVRKIDPTQAPLTAKVTFHGASGDPMLVAAGPGSVWTAKDDAIYRVATPLDPYSSPTGKPVAIPAREDEQFARARMNAMAVDARDVWVVGDDGDRRLWQIDSSSARIRHTTSLPFAPAGVATGLGGVWVTDQIGNRLYEFDPATARIVRAIPVGREPIGVAVGAGAVWVANAIDGTISKVDPTGGRVVATIPVGGSPTRVAVGAGAVWVAADEG